MCRVLYAGQECVLPHGMPGSKWRMNDDGPVRRQAWSHACGCAVRVGDRVAVDVGIFELENHQDCASTWGLQGQLPQSPMSPTGLR
jgi:hypothetical protein